MLKVLQENGKEKIINGSSRNMLLLDSVYSFTRNLNIALSWLWRIVHFYLNKIIFLAKLFQF